MTQTGLAHAFLDHADPAVGCKIHNSPAEVRIWFTEKLEPALSRIQVFNAAASEVDKRNVHIDASNPALLEVALPALQPGKYKVTWRVVSVDTHVTTGEFTFEITP
jgi:methionine-rich copper-binding protein CopC